MPPKPKFTREEIIETALNIVSEKGTDALTARELGSALGSSARPIFTLFENMEELQGEVRSAAMKRFENFEMHKMRGVPLFKQVGIKMVLFGMKEPKLYRLLFMREKSRSVTLGEFFGELGKTAELCIDTIRREYSLSKRNAERLFEDMWIYTFGIGALCATAGCGFSEERIGEMLSGEFKALMMLIKSSGEE